ncbi:hypothetical protein CDAR_533421 [Caerostris darwini]|uniref:Uncharacterized protein n=1 Tax=Caerostris darwini TaxID=1538125 RepID=A0AAV4S9S3_9ARAC|nr:hypothetical protein CDAR_533421 [Caerostris darwini]
MLIASESCFLLKPGSNSVSTFRWPEVRSQGGPSQVRPPHPTGFAPLLRNFLRRYVRLNRKTSVPESFRRMEMHGASLCSSASVREKEREREKVDRGLLHRLMAMEGRFIAE